MFCLSSVAKDTRSYRMDRVWIEANIDNAVWGLFGAALISPTGTTMVGSQQAIGVVNKN